MEEPFQVVKHKNFKKQKHQAHWCQSDICHEASQREDDIIVDSNAVVQKLHNCRLKLQKTTYVKKLIEGDICSAGGTELTADKHILKPVENIVAYGLGHFSTCPIARFQFALLLLLTDVLEVPRQCCFVYDPVFSSAEKALVADFGFQLLAVNEEGKRQSVRCTLYYMPHCGKPLYNNLLWANWRPDHLANTVLLGNSFRTMSCSFPSRILQQHYRYIHNITPHVTEIELDQFLPTELQDVFNDMSIHVFNTDSLSGTGELWLDTVEPQYSGNEFDSEIVWTQQLPSNT